MVAPYAAADVVVEIDGPLRPLYVEITRRMMQHWGVEVTGESGKGANAGPSYRVKAGQTYRPQNPYVIEPDASSASYFFAAAAVTGGRVTIPGLGPEALQGDVRFATEVLVEMGCNVTSDSSGLTVTGPPLGELRGVDRDMSLISDTSLTLAAIAPFANSPTTIRNIAHSRLQECDRVSAICTELARLGVEVEERPDGCTIYPAREIVPTTVQTYRDHRVAMSFALVGLKVPGITIADPGCVAKTFPDYWQRLDRLRAC
jgi:3-phosphoshikimate 1-carboxyvinyltransferase